MNPVRGPPLAGEASRRVVSVGSCFHRVGGLDQVVLETGADLAKLEQLDPKLWVALSCPTKGLEIDGRTLELLDTSPAS